MNHTPRLLHIEDEEQDALLVRRSLESDSTACEITVIRDATEFRQAVDRGGFDLILSDSSVAGLEGISAMQQARERVHDVPFVFVCGECPPERAIQLRAAGATDAVSKDHLFALPGIVARALDTGRRGGPETVPAQPMERLIGVIQQLSLARDLAGIMQIVRRAARELTGADGATFVLREKDQCHYADEDAIASLWKGCRFPLSACISGWAMRHRQAVAIEDIYADSRIPADAYRPTFVKSLVMVPIRTAVPIGAIGNYWASHHQATPQEIQLLQALADSTSIAMENVALYHGLEERIRKRTADLQAANADLESFSYSVSHDLRAPLRSIDGFSRILDEDYAPILDDEGRGHLQRIRNSAAKMNDLIEDFLKLARLGRQAVKREPVDLAVIAQGVLEGLRSASPDRQVEVSIPDTLPANADSGLLRIVMENLLSNAWKYTSKRRDARIEIGSTLDAGGQIVYHVRDNGVGFDLKYADRLFGVFQRLHTAKEFAGTGVGLATVQRILRQHGGRIWAEAAIDQGATFHFTLGE